MGFFFFGACFVLSMGFFTIEKLLGKELKNHYKNNIANHKECFSVNDRKNDYLKLIKFKQLKATD